MSANPIVPDVNFARKLIEHFCWEDERVWTLAIVPLSDEQFVQDVGFGLGSIQRECWHIMDTQWTCLQLIRGDSPLESLGKHSALDRAAMQAQWSAIHASWTQFAREFDAGLFFSDCAFADDGRETELKVWQLIFDVIYQGTTHRAEVMRMVAEVHDLAEFDLSLMKFLTGVFRK